MPETRSTEVVVDLSAFAHNLETATRLAGPETEVMAILKADAYGHGSVPLADVAVQLGCPSIGVATVGEGTRLRRAGIQTEVVVLGGVPPGAEEAVLDYRLEAVVFDEGGMERLQRAVAPGRQTPVHLKVDTGMGRLGFLPGALPRALEVLAACDRLRLEGIMTHYARADEEDPAPTRRQGVLFQEALDLVLAAGFRPRWTHARNSGALLLDRGPRGNLARPGIILYGSLPPGLLGREAEFGLRPVLTFRTRILQVKEVPDGWQVSYGGRYRAVGPRRIAVLPVGYADGYLRYNSPGEVLIRGRRAPLAGTVCMDYVMADVTEVEGAAAGEEAVLIGHQGTEHLSADRVAERGGTISYEVFCGISQRVPRRYTAFQGRAA